MESSLLAAFSTLKSKKVGADNRFPFQDLSIRLAKAQTLDDAERPIGAPASWTGPRREENKAASSCVIYETVDGRRAMGEYKPGESPALPLYPDMLFRALLRRPITPLDGDVDALQDRWLAMLARYDQVLEAWAKGELSSKGEAGPPLQLAAPSLPFSLPD